MHGVEGEDGSVHIVRSAGSSTHWLEAGGRKGWCGWCCRKWEGQDRAAGGQHHVRALQDSVAVRRPVPPTYTERPPHPTCRRRGHVVTRVPCCKVGGLDVAVDVPGLMHRPYGPQGAASQGPHQGQGRGVAQLAAQLMQVDAQQLLGGVCVWEEEEEGGGGRGGRRAYMQVDAQQLCE